MFGDQFPGCIEQIKPAGFEVNARLVIEDAESEGAAVVRSDDRRVERRVGGTQVRLRKVGPGNRDHADPFARRQHVLNQWNLHQG